MFTDSNTYVQTKGNGLTGTLREHIADTCELNHKYYLPEFPDCYFIVRKSLEPGESERVCLYRENVINAHLFGSIEPGTAWLSNDHRLGRSLSTLHRDMDQKAHEFVTRNPIRHAH